MQMCAVTQLVRLGIDTTVQQNLAACLTMPTDFPAPGSADSFVPSPQFGLLQQFHFIFGKSYQYLLNLRQGQVTAAEPVSRSLLEAFQSFLAGYFACFHFSHSTFLSISGKCRVLWCLDCCTGRMKFMLDPWHWSNCVAVLCSRYGMVALSYLSYSGNASLKSIAVTLFYSWLLCFSLLL